MVLKPVKATNLLILPNRSIFKKDISFSTTKILQYNCLITIVSSQLFHHTTFITIYIIVFPQARMVVWRGRPVGVVTQASESVGSWAICLHDNIWAICLHDHI